MVIHSREGPSTGPLFTLGELVSETTTVRTWTQRLKLVGKAAAAATAVIGVATALFGAYQAYQETKLNAKTSYEALVSKVNSMAERMAYMEGRISSMPAATGPAWPGPAITPPLPPPEMVAVASDKDGVPDRPLLARPPRKLKVNAYQQLPSSLDSLIKSKDAYAE